MHQTDVLVGEWITCGIGVAAGPSDQVMAMVVRRKAWEGGVGCQRQRSLLERLALGE